MTTTKLDVEIATKLDAEMLAMPPLDGRYVHGELSHRNGTYSIFFFPHTQRGYYHAAVMFTDNGTLERVRRGRKEAGGSDVQYTRRAMRFDSVMDMLRVFGLPAGVGVGDIEWDDIRSCDGWERNPFAEKVRASTP